MGWVDGWVGIVDSLSLALSLLSVSVWACFT